MCCDCGCKECRGHHKAPARVEKKQECERHPVAGGLLGMALGALCGDPTGIVVGGILGSVAGNVCSEDEKRKA
jgi:outer membrane lipoprotein SlyB